MVVNTYYPFVDLHRGTDRYWRQFRSSTIYLHFVLKDSAVQQDRYKTMLVIVSGLLVIAWIADIYWLNYVAAVLGVVCIFFPAAARGIEWAWFKLAMGLGYVNSRILLSIIYFVFLLPIAWLSRLFTKDPLALRNRKTSTLFVNRDHLYTRKDLENIW